MTNKSGWRLVKCFALTGMLLTYAAVAAAIQAPWTTKAPAEVMRLLQQGEPQALIVLFDDTAVQLAAETLRRQLRVKNHTTAVQAMKSSRYQMLKQNAFNKLPVGQHEMLTDYSHLPMAFVRFRSIASLQALLTRDDVVAVYRDEKKFSGLTQSLPLIGQASVASAGNQGKGTTVLVIDSGVNYTTATFGSCTSPGVPLSCRVNYYQNIADSSTVLDTAGHGSVVSAITLGVAPQTNIAMLNVFGNNASTSDSLILSAIDFGIANQAALKIVAMNMSLGDNSNNTAPCSNRGTNPYVTAFENTKAAGIVVTVSSGNNAYTSGIAKPACTPNAVSVGAVYDANVGARSFSACSDSSSVADKPTCYSNSATYLSLLAPGSIVTTAVGGGDGTSFAAPMVAGAAAVLRSAFFTETADQTISRLTSTGVLVTDARNNITTPRLNLLAAAQPANDAFAKRITLSGVSGGTLGYSVLASKENGEPLHAGNSGGASVWWKWISPGEGQVSLDTHTSVIDTLLGVYTGSAVNSLALVAANDDDGSPNFNSGVLFQAHAGVEYQIAVDGFGGAAGDVALNWNFNANANADLSITGSGTPPSVTQGDNITYTLNVQNAGPQAATNVVVTNTLPVGTSLVSSSVICSQSGSSLTCALGNILSAASTSLSVTVKSSNTTPGSISNSASVTSDVADLNTANNSASQTTVVTAPAPPPVASSADTDVPTLPEWGALLMAGLLLGTAHWRRKVGRAY